MPQQQKTDKFRIDVLPELTERQEIFVKGILDGLSASDAYRRAYSTEDSKPETIWASASRLRHDPKVNQWLAAAQIAKLGSATLTAGQHMQELERLREIAVETGNIGAAVNAEVSRGKAAGHYVEKFEDVSSHDPIETLNRLAEHSPEVAKTLAAKHGINWTQH